MSSALERSLSVIELLAEHPEGLAVSAVAQALDLPVSGAHRILNDLTRLGYARQMRNQGDYALTIKLASMGLSFLSAAGVNDVAQPILDQLAQDSRELIRLSVVDGDNLVWVGVAQGATGGLRYDPGREQGVVVHLASSAGGQAWLSTMTDEEALTRVAAQGLRPRHADPGVDAPATIADLLEQLRRARELGYSHAVNSYMTGMAAMAVPVRYLGTGPVIGCLSIAGPAVRMTDAHVQALAPVLAAAARDLGEASRGSTYFSTTLRAMGETQAERARGAA